MRYFEIITEYADKEINLPKRATATSVGYDFEAAEDVVIPSMKKWAKQDDEGNYYFPGEKPTLVKTGIKAFFPHDEGLFLFNRSSNPFKLGLLLANGAGVVEADYWNNPGNEGHIMFAYWNLSSKDVHIKKGERVGQGVFMPYYITSDDEAGGSRQGGFGSTGS